MRLTIRPLIAPACAILLLSACSTPKDIAYFPEINSATTITAAANKGITLKTDDKLSIVVNTKSAELNNVLNMPVNAQVIGGTEMQAINQGQGISGFVVDPEGNINFPLIGKVKAEGLTRTELASHLKKLLEEKNVATDAVVTVGFMNLGFSILGEVNGPGFYSFYHDKTTILQAISRAGDLNLYGKRNNVKLVRTNGDKQEIYVVDLQDTEALMKSPAYILQQNDVIYVEPNNFRKRQATANASEITKASFWLSAISAMATMAVLIFK